MKHKILLSIVLISALTACQTETSAQQSQQKSETKNIVDTLLPENVANYKEKYDIAQFMLVAAKSGMSEGEEKEREWNARLTSAKSSADVKAIFRDQLAFYQGAETALTGMEMKSEQGKAMKAQLLRGVTGIRQILEQMLAVDFDTPEGVAKVNKLVAALIPHTEDVAQGMQVFMDMRKQNGFSDAKLEAQFQEKVQQLEKFSK